MKPSKEISLCFLPQWSINQPPIGIAYLTAYLMQHNFKVHQRDLSIEMYSELPVDKKHICESYFHENFLDHGRYNSNVASDILPFIERWAQELASNSSPFLGFTVLSSNLIPTEILINKIKELNSQKIIILGGPHCTRYEGGFQLIENSNVDYVIPDEGEETLHELLEALCNEINPKDIVNIKGILFRDPDFNPEKETIQTTEVIKGITISRSNRIIDTGNRPLIAQINDLPIPIFHGFKLSAYKQLTIPILGSRGCIYKCTFCSETVLWKRYRYRTGENLYSEFKFQFEKTGTIGYYIVDSLINGNVSELIRMCDYIIDNSLTVYWGGKASIRKEMTREVLEKMYKAGCRNLDYGIESGSSKVLRDMKKGFRLPTATQVLRDSHEAGIEVGIFMMVGFPTESDEDYQASKIFINEHKQWLHHVTPGYGFGIQPGSDTYINQKEYGIEWRGNEWFSKHTTPEIRNYRVQDFRKFLQESGVNIT